MVLRHTLSAFTLSWLIVCSVAGGVCAAWQLEMVDGAAGSGGFCSLALDAADQGAISYFDAAHGWLKFARESGAGWTVEMVDSSSALVGRWTSVALDSAGLAHISYQDQEYDLYYLRNALKYARQDGAGWTIEVVATGDSSFDGVGQYSSLALTAADEPRISATWAGMDEFGRLFSLAYYFWPLGAGAGWGAEAVAPAEQGAQYYTSLALDATGRPSVGCADWTDQDRLVLAQQFGQWQSEEVEQAAGAGAQCSLVLDGEGRPHLSYSTGYDNSLLKYAVRVGEAWQIEVVDSDREFASCTGLALDASGEPHIGYKRRADQTLVVAAHTAGEWRFESVDSMPAASDGSISLAVGADDQERVAYQSDGRLKYARQLPPGTPTPSATLTPTLTETPGCTRTPTRSPTPTLTPAEIQIELLMPSHNFWEGWPCWLKLHVQNPGSEQEVDLWVLLDANGEYWYWRYPDGDFEPHLVVPAQADFMLTLISEFVMPALESSGPLYFYAVMEDPRWLDLDHPVSNVAIYEFRLWE